LFIGIVFSAIHLAQGKYLETISFVAPISLAFSWIATLFIAHHVYGKQGIIVFILLSFFALCIEYIGLTTGFPYGDFSYSNHLGAKIAGILPFTVFFGWSPLLLWIWIIFHRITSKKWLVITLSLALLVLSDFFIDPAAVRLNFWQYFEPFYYGVPLSNFVGWIISGCIAFIICSLFLTKKPQFRTEIYDLIFVLLGSQIAFFGLISVLSGHLATAFLLPAYCAILFLLWKKTNEVAPTVSQNHSVTSL
jgi:putative membrane protein